MNKDHRFQRVAIKNFAEVITGGTPSTVINEYWDDGTIPWLNSGELNNRYITQSSNYITESGLKNSNAKIMPPGTVMIALTGATTGVTALLQIEACANQSVTGILPSDNHDPKYLYFYLSSLRQQILDKSWGGAQKHISQGYVKEIEVPFPPLDEQRRIAAILDKADAIRQKRQESIRLTEEFLRSTFLELFGDPVTNPKGWKIEPLENLVNFTTGKLDSNAAVKGGAYPFFTCSREDLQIDNYAFDCEALLLAGNNASADYSVKYYKGKFNAYQRTYVITMSRLSLSYRYMQYALEMKLQDMKRLSKGTNTKYLTLGILNQLEFQIPDEKSQRLFDRIIASLGRHSIIQNDALKLSETNFTALVQSAFRGELS